MKIANGVDKLVGRTPLLELTRLKEKNNLFGNIIVKLEYYNPSGSVKDRAARQMIQAAQEQGFLKKDSVIIEPTSGNIGISLSMMAAINGYRAIMVMPSTMSVERQKLMKAYGSEIVLTDGKLGMKGAIDKANELAQEIENSFIPRQFDNPNNPLAHYQYTANEIWEDTDGKIDFFVAGVGTGGTLSGTAKALKEKNNNIKVVAVEPTGSPVISKGEKGPHKIQGIGAGFIPGNLDTSIIDSVIVVDDSDAFSSSGVLARTEGVLVGISSGAALKAAIDLASKEENKGKNIVAILPDTGERYLSTALFEN
ncbi:MAG: cysteine synthase A [Sphaerochaetaceae bacterium]|nr:cysteine synthase A [Sphaerochaetaceae bacterium]MDC7237320.1 cysteine synthase A [Sphaerochaetaceae bacterium]